MKQFLTIIGLTILLSCGGSNDIPPPPKEKCENISIDNLPVITHGFYPNTYDSVVVETFLKNSNFDTLLNRYKIKLTFVMDKERVQRDFTLPKEITTATDIRLIFNDSLEYKIDIEKIKLKGKFKLMDLSKFPEKDKIWGTKYNFNFSGVAYFRKIQFDTTKKYGILDGGFYCGGKCGQGFRIYIKKENGKWKVDKINGTWIS